VHAYVRRHPAAADAALAIAFAVAALVSVQAVYDGIRGIRPAFREPATLGVVASLLAVTVPLAWRRRYPLSTASVVVVAVLVSRIVVDIPEAAITMLAVSLAIYSAAVHGQPRFRTLVLAACFGAVLAQVVRALFFAGSSAGLEPLAQGFYLIYNAVILALPWLLGSVIRSLRERERDLADRATDLQREREQNARQAVFAERVRIARELHDVVAHHVSVMGIQAGAARRVMGREPDKAAASLSLIEASSRQAVVELDRLLGFLRRDDEADELTPQPRLAQLGDLVDQAAQGDLAVTLSIEGTPRELSPTVEVSAYRIIQEALTNARKHSGGANATVRVRYEASALEVEVLDDGIGRTAPLAVTGHGLIGMRERANLHGGHLRVGPRPEGGFAVHATFPVNGSAP
jgi:signal transduction histidine kinase